MTGLLKRIRAISFMSGEFIKVGYFINMSTSISMREVSSEVEFKFISPNRTCTLKELTVSVWKTYRAFEVGLVLSIAH